MHVSLWRHTQLDSTHPHHSNTTQNKTKIQTASFPSPEHDGTFSEWSAASQREQRQQLGVVLGEAFFAAHPDPKVRASTGYVFIKEMDRGTFTHSASQLRGRIESVGGGK